MASHAPRDARRLTGFLTFTRASLGRLGGHRLNRPASFLGLSILAAVNGHRTRRDCQDDSEVIFDAETPWRCLCVVLVASWSVLAVPVGQLEPVSCRGGGCNAASRVRACACVPARARTRYQREKRFTLINTKTKYKKAFSEGIGVYLLLGYQVML